MKSSEHNRCAAAQHFYLDYHNETDRNLIPPSVLAHIQQCPQCQSRARQVAGLMQDCGRGASGGLGALWLRSMKMHFKYLGEPVDCRVARFFMPSMLLPGLALRVPTPITSHIGNCKKCGERLQWLKSCCLTIGQLQRLHSMVAAEAGDTQENPGDETLDRIARLDFSGLSERVLRQTLRQADCFRQIYEKREQTRPAAGPDSPLPNGHLTDSRLFDLIIPECEETLSEYGCPGDIEHVRTCPDCHARLQLLYLEFFDFLNDSAINRVTVSRLSGRAAKWLPSLVSSGLRVEIDESNARAGSGAPHRRPGLSRRRVLLGMTTAAAVLLVAGVLSFMNPGAKAVDPDQISRLMAGVPLLRIETWDDGTGQTISDCWLDRNREQSCTQSNNRVLFKDLKKRIMIERDQDGKENHTTLSERLTKSGRAEMAKRGNFAPLYTNGNIKGDWTKIQSTPDYDVFELVLPATSGAMLKYVIHLEPATRFIQRYETYSKAAHEKDYRLETRTLFSRLTEAEYLEHVVALGFNPGH